MEKTNSNILAKIVLVAKSTAPMSKRTAKVIAASYSIKVDTSKHFIL